MRDLLIVAIVFGFLPFCLIRPSIGVLVYSWLSYMNPHRLTYGFAYNFPFAQGVAIITLLGLFVGKDRKKFPWCGTTVIWMMLIVWLIISTFLSIDTESSMLQLEKILKIKLMMFVTLWVMGSKEKIIQLTWVIAMSMAFYGVKGGVFGVLTGGAERVWGPPGTFIAGNNEMGLALIMTLPLVWFLQMNTQNIYIRWGLRITFALCIVATLSTQSRGALVGVCTMVLFLWLKGNRKIILGALLIMAVPVVYVAMPDSWHERMSTIGTYEQDASAMERIIAWEFAVIAANTKFTGVGPGVLSFPETYQAIAPAFFAELLASGGNSRAAHSIYFGMLGQNGWVGLIIFLALLLASWRTGSWVIARSKKVDSLQWAANLAAMLQVSLVGYASTGAFLSLEYFDFFYNLVALLILLKFVVTEELESKSPPELASATK